MIQKFAIGLVRQMAEEKIIEKKYEEYYGYVLISMVEKVITVGTILLISLVARMFIPTIFFLIFLLSLRKRTGGYHLNSFCQCYLGTVLTYLGILKINQILVNNQKLLLGMLLISMCVIEIIGTVNHPDIHMDLKELAESKKAARLLVLIAGGVIFFLFRLGADIVYVGYMASAVILCATLLCIAKIIKQEVRESEES